MGSSRMCPACGKKMEYDLFTSCFVCSECGRSESAVKKPSFAPSSSEKSSDEPLTEITEDPVQEEPSSEEPTKEQASKPAYMSAIIAPVKEMKKEPDEDLREMYPASGNDPKGILRFFAGAFECDSVEEVLVSAEKMKSEEYLDRVSLHPSLQTFQETCPKSRIPQNIRAYCETVRRILHAEEELYRSREDIKRTEQTVKKQKKIDAILLEKKPEKDHSSRYQLLLVPIIFVITFFIGRGRRGTTKPILPRNAETFFTLLRIAAFLYVVIFLFWFVEAVVKRTKEKRRKGAGDRVVSQKKSYMDETLERIFSLQKEKEKILREIVKEEESISEKG